MESGQASPLLIWTPQNQNENRIEQSGADYDPQVGAMRWPRLATNVSLSPCGSSLTRDVRINNDSYTLQYD